MSNVIYNNGIILTPTTMTTLFNETINTTESFVYLNAHCEDDNGKLYWKIKIKSRSQNKLIILFIVNE